VVARADKKNKAAARGADPLAEGVGAFARGDYVRARALLEPKVNDASLSEAERAQARDLVGATSIEPGALYTGLGAIGLLLVVIALTAWFQSV
jgi:hypothetical protein